MTDTIAIYLNRQQYYFLRHILKALLNFYNENEKIEKKEINFNTIKAYTKILNDLENNKYKKYNKEIVNSLLEKLENYNIVDNIKE
jgi:hypothetical protein